MTTRLQTQPLAVTLWEDQGFYYMARVLGEAGTPVTQSSLSAIAYAVYDRNDDDAVVASGTLTVSAVVFNTLQTPTLDPRWTADRTGYNLGASIPASAFPQGGRQYRLEITMTPVTGDAIRLYADVSTLERIGG